MPVGESILEGSVGVKEGEVERSCKYPGNVKGEKQKNLSSCDGVYGFC